MLIGIDQKRDLNDPGSSTGDKTRNTPETPAFTELDNVTTQLYSQLLGLLDQQSNTDLANEQIGQLSSILAQQSSLAGKDLAAGTWAGGGATQANIAGILRGEQQALAQGVTQINQNAQDRLDENRRFALSAILGLRSQLSDERQHDFDNALNQAMFDHQQWVDREGFAQAEEDREAAFWASIIQSIADIIPG